MLGARIDTQWIRYVPIVIALFGAVENSGSRDIDQRHVMGERQFGRVPDRKRVRQVSFLRIFFAVLEVRMRAKVYYHVRGKLPDRQLVSGKIPEVAVFQPRRI